MKNALYFGALAMAFGMATAAQAAANHTWVSRSGVDSGTTCAVTAPCATLAYAHSQTNPGGTIDILDSGDYTAVRITKSITIKAAAGISATITGANSNNQIWIQAGAADVVVLDGLTIDGTTTSNNYSGVYLDIGAAVYIINCTIKNNLIGIYNFSDTPNARIFVQRSNLLRNGTGVYARVSGSGSRVVSVLDSLIDGSTVAGVQAENATIIGMARTVINAGPVAIQTLGTGQVISVGPSNVVSGTGAFTLTVPFN